MWANLGKGKIEKCGRITLTYLLSMLLLIFGFLLVVELMAVKESTAQNTSICGDLTITAEEAF